MRVAVRYSGKEPSRGSLCFGNMLGSRRQKWRPGQEVSPGSSPGHLAQRPALSLLRGRVWGDALSIPQGPGVGQ